MDPVVISHLDRKPHNRCFVEAAASFLCALRKLDAKKATIVFGSNDRNLDCKIPGAILYNAEAVAHMDDPLRVIAGNVKNHVIWDYAISNVRRWQSLGLRAVHVPLGYVPEMETIVSATKEDIDVLFYGWWNERRGETLSALSAAGLKVLSLPYGTYGAARDRWIARSKIVLNLHYYDHSIFEIFRVSHLLVNKQCVVTEDGGKDENLEQLAMETCAYASRADIVGLCLQLAANDRVRHHQGRQGYVQFKRIDLVENVRQALEMSK